MRRPRRGGRRLPHPVPAALGGCRLCCQTAAIDIISAIRLKAAALVSGSGARSRVDVARGKVSEGAQPSLGAAAEGRDGFHRARRDLSPLLDACARGDRAAFGHLYDQTVGACWRLAMLVTADEEAASAVVTETYEELWRYAGTFDSRQMGPLPWILHRVHAKARDARRGHHLG